VAGYLDQTQPASPAVCNHYSITTVPEAVLRLFRANHNRAAVFEPKDAVFPWHMAPVVRQLPDGDRELSIMPPLRMADFHPTRRRVDANGAIAGKGSRKDLGPFEILVDTFEPADITIDQMAMLPEHGKGACPINPLHGQNQLVRSSSWIRSY
jgi:hypothetical protein